jgi:hypothetical protein
MREVDQLVGGVAHRGDHDTHVVARLTRGDDSFGDALDPFGVGDGGAAVLLHHESHADSLTACAGAPADSVPRFGRCLQDIFAGYRRTADPPRESVFLP